MSSEQRVVNLKMYVEPPKSVTTYSFTANRAHKLIKAHKGSVPKRPHTLALLDKVAKTRDGETCGRCGGPKARHMVWRDGKAPVGRAPKSWDRMPAHRHCKTDTED